MKEIIYVVFPNQITTEEAQLDWASWNPLYVFKTQAEAEQNLEKRGHGHYWARIEY